VRRFELWVGLADLRVMELCAEKGWQQDPSGNGDSGDANKKLWVVPCEGGSKLGWISPKNHVNLRIQIGIPKKYHPCT
jgi:hypothetical protein